MDYHFILPEDENKSKVFSVKKFIPVFLLFALLPAFIFFLSAPPDLKFKTRAGNDAELRIWVEPAQSITSVNRPLSFQVFASYDSEEGIVPGVVLEFKAEGIELKSNSLSYKRPFSGEVLLGVFEATPFESGLFSIEIPEELVKVIGEGKPLTVVTSSATVRVR